MTENELLDDAAVTPSGYVVNDVYPSNPPLPTPMPSALLPLQTMRTIGENLTDANVTWAWYSGGWYVSDRCSDTTVRLCLCLCLRLFPFLHAHVSREELCSRE